MRAGTDQDASTAARYRRFGEFEAAGLSATYEAWALGIAADADTASLIDELPWPKRQPNLVFSASRLLGADAGPYDVYRDWLVAHWPQVREVCLTHATQTNEAARCALHLPVLASLGGPLALLEVGTSAGLCLLPDRYSYRYRDMDGARPQLDPPAGPSPVVLDCSIEGGVPVPAALPEVVWRAGVDLHPLDVRDAADVAWLDALIWPEHDDRRARLRAAVALAAADPPRIVAGDLNERLAEVAANAPSDATLVVFHTAVLAYLDADDRRRFSEAVRELPGHWLSVEDRRVFDDIPVRDDVPNRSSDIVLALDGVQRAWAHPHGRAIRWVADL